MKLPEQETSSPAACLAQPLMTLRQLNLRLIVKHQILHPFLVIPAEARLARV